MNVTDRVARRARELGYIIECECGRRRAHRCGGRWGVYWAPPPDKIGTAVRTDLHSRDDAFAFALELETGDPVWMRY